MRELRDAGDYIINSMQTFSKGGNFSKAEKEILTARIRKERLKGKLTRSFNFNMKVCPYQTDGSKSTAKNFFRKCFWRRASINY